MVALSLNFVALDRLALAVFTVEFKRVESAERSRLNARSRALPTISCGGWKPRKHNDSASCQRTWTAKSPPSPAISRSCVGFQTFPIHINTKIAVLLARRLPARGQRLRESRFAAVLESLSCYFSRDWPGMGRGCSPVGVELRELSSPLGSCGVLCPPGPVVPGALLWPVVTSGPGS
jgi:hypothetical protein